MSRVSHGPDRLRVVFDDPGLVANAGLLLVATLTARLGLEALVDATVRLGRGGFAPGRKVLTLVHAMVAGGSHIDHTEILRAGATARVLGHRVMAPSTVGSFLRAFSFGHVRQLDAVIAGTIRQAWTMGAGPGGSRLVIDVDSTICEVHGHKKHGAAYGYTRVLGYHPLLATRADTGEILHARMRKGSANTGRGMNRFVEELIARVRACGATGGLVVRVDSGFWSNKTIATLGRLGVRFTMTVRSNPAITAAIAGIPDSDWVDIAYTDNGGAAQVAECAYNGLRLIVRRTRLAEGAQPALFPTWRHHAFLTDLAADTAAVDKFHRHHAVVELAIRDLKENAGLDHVPSGVFAANGAWLACAVLAHNLIRWTTMLGGLVPDDQTHTVGRTHRIRHVTMPARLVNRAGTLTLRAPARWPWAAGFSAALERLRALQPATG